MAKKLLLERLAFQMGCSYLSDLRFLSGTQQAALAHKLKSFPASDEDLWEWNDALFYLTGAPPEEQAQQAKDKLTQILSSAHSS